MPTYEYECKSCKHIFERFQSITARPLRKCPECGKSVKRIISAGSGIIFKGSGFYQTDYKGTASGERSKKGPDGKPAPCGKTDKCSSCGA